jgi:hypothetical protein
MVRIVCGVLCSLLWSTPTLAADPPSKGVKAVAVSVEPKEAKPGQTVTVKLTVELEPGFTIYATTQTDKLAADFVTTIPYPAPGAVVFVGSVKEPESPVLKAEPALGIKALRVFEGKVVFERAAVVAPTAAAGPTPIKIAGLKLQACDDKNCYPGKAISPEAELKVLPGPAVEVEKKYKEEVEKALKK